MVKEVRGSGIVKGLGGLGFIILLFFSKASRALCKSPGSLYDPDRYENLNG